MVPIMVTMIMIVVISLIVLGFAQVTRTNQRAALDRQLSTQAFYAAETGLNDAKSYIRANPNTASTTNCNDFITTLAGATPAVSNKLNADGSVAYTCLTVNNTPSSLQYKTVGVGRAIATPLFSSVAIPSLTVSWQANATGSANAADCSSIGTKLPAASGGGTVWNCAYGLLRLDLMPETTASDAATLAANTRTFYFKPTAGAGSTVAVNNFTGSTSRGALVPVGCAPAASRTCRITINLNGTASTNRYYARLSPVYKDLQNVTISSSSPAVTFSGSQAVLDSTGRAQDVLRRVQIRVSQLGSSLQPYAGLQSTGDICKLLSITGSFTTNACAGGPVTGGNPPTTPPVTVGVIIDQIDVGNYHVCANSLAGDGFCWGKNDFGALGNGTNNNSSTPFSVTTTGALAGKKIVGTSAGYNHTCVVDSAGLVYCWGYNSQGQLGNGASGTTNNPNPTAVVTTGAISGKKVVKVNGGDAHTCALTQDGKIFCWGGNNYGQLGTGGTSDSFVPVEIKTSGISGSKTMVDVSAGYAHTCGLTSEGRAYCWGFNGHGQLGNGNTSDSSTPVAVAGNLRFKRISAGDEHTCAITLAGAAYCWGYNEQGQVGIGTMINASVPTAVSTSGVLAGKNITDIAAGYRHTCAIGDGNLYCWGNNDAGQLGNGEVFNTKLSPVAVVTTGAISGKTMVDVATGRYSSCAVAAPSNGGGVYCWGKNDDGQLGDGARPVDSSVPVSVTIL